MPNRTARIASVVLVNILAGLSLATLARGEPAAPDNCLSAPTGDAPAGSHWRYHIDHVNKRNCWYLRLAGGGVAQAAPQNGTTAPSPPAKPSVADARAEFRPQATRENNTAANPPAAAAGTAPEGNANQSSPANASIWNAAPPAATRWADVPAAPPAPNTASPAPTAPATPAPANDVPQPSADSVQAVAPSAPVAQLSTPIEQETILTLIAATLSALAFAGAAALIARRRRRTRHLPRHVTQSARGPIWETTDDDRIVLSDHRYPDHRDYRPRFARGAGGAPAPGGRKPESARRAPRYAQR